MPPKKSTNAKQSSTPNGADGPVLRLRRVTSRVAATTTGTSENVVPRQTVTEAAPAPRKRVTSQEDPAVQAESLMEPSPAPRLPPSPTPVVYLFETPPPSSPPPPLAQSSPVQPQAQSPPPSSPPQPPRRRPSATAIGGVTSSMARMAISPKIVQKKYDNLTEDITRHIARDPVVVDAAAVTGFDLERIDLMPEITLKKSTNGVVERHVDRATGFRSNEELFAARNTLAIATGDSAEEARDPYRRNQPCSNSTCRRHRMKVEYADSAVMPLHCIADYEEEYFDSLRTFLHTLYLEAVPVPGRSLECCEDGCGRRRAGCEDVGGRRRVRAYPACEQHMPTVLARVQESFAAATAEPEEERMDGVSD